MKAPIPSASPRSKSFGFAAAISAALLLSGGCAHLDKFSSRATEFNVQVSDAQNRTMLLNVMRAAHRFPMHFTELTTLSGSESFSATAGLDLPFGSLKGGNGVRKGTASGTVTQSPAFNVAVLETQEFYRGMLMPLSPEHMLAYVHEGVSKEFVFTLMLGSIVYRESATAEPQSIENNFHAVKSTLNSAQPPAPRPLTPALCPTASNEYSCFRDVLRALLKRRLTIERTQKAANVGPPVEERSIADPKLVAKLESQGLKIAELHPEDCGDRTEVCPKGLDGMSAEKQRALQANGVLFQIQKDVSGYRFCFDETPPTKLNAPAPAKSDLPQMIGAAPIPEKLICRARIPKTVVKPEAERRQEERENEERRKSEPQRPDEGVFSLGTFTLEVQPRSTEGLVYYLGEIARCNLGLDTSGGSDCKVMPSVDIPYRADGTDDILFAVHKRGEPHAVAAGAREVVIDWYGTNFAVNVDPSARDRSGQVLRVLTQLLALNRSSKDFPVPTVVPLITQ